MGGGVGGSRRPRPSSAPRPRGKFTNQSMASSGGGGGGGGGGVRRGSIGGGGAKAAKHLGGSGGKGGRPKKHMSEDEARILEGSRYKMTPKQAEVYTGFTAMLADFDVFEMVQILEDALKDAQKQTGLDDYYGAVDS